MVSEAQKKALAKYLKKNVKQVALRFFPKDMDLYEYVQTKENMTSYILDLIRKDMESQSPTVED